MKYETMIVDRLIEAANDLREHYLKPVTHDYVAGFAFSKGSNYVALVTKIRPQWQFGHLNAVGGKIEDGESPLAAQVREWNEECSLEVEDNWRQFLILKGRSEDGNMWRVVFHWTYIKDDDFVTTKNYGKTDEVIRVYPRGQVVEGSIGNMIGNIPMLLEAAVCSIKNKGYDGYKMLEIREVS